MWYFFKSGLKKETGNHCIDHNKLSQQKNAFKIGYVSYEEKILEQHWNIIIIYFLFLFIFQLGDFEKKNVILFLSIYKFLTILVQDLAKNALSRSFNKSRKKVTRVNNKCLISFTEDFKLYYRNGVICTERIVYFLCLSLWSLSWVAEKERTKRILFLIKKSGGRKKQRKTQTKNTTLTKKLNKQENKHHNKTNTKKKNMKNKE